MLSLPIFRNKTHPTYPYSLLSHSYFFVIDFGQPKRVSEIILNNAEYYVKKLFLNNYTTLMWQDFNFVYQYQLMNDKLYMLYKGSCSMLFIVLWPFHTYLHDQAKMNYKWLISDKQVYILVTHIAVSFGDRGGWCKCRHSNHNTF